MQSFVFEAIAADIFGAFLNLKKKICWLGVYSITIFSHKALFKISLFRKIPLPQ